MARTMAATDKVVYRACVWAKHPPSRFHPEEWESTEYYGPYSSIGAARAMVAARANQAREWHRATEVEGWVETAEFIWNPAGKWPE